MTKIFISYRRQDTKPTATLIYRELKAHFDALYGLGAVFMDVHGIPKGLDFHDYLTEQVAKAELQLALIADRWLTVTDENGKRRLDNEDDFVRIEIVAALERKIPIIPVYVDGVKPLRAEDLPEPMKPLARRNGAFLDTGVDFDVHIKRLIGDIEPHLNGAFRPRAAASAEVAAPAVVRAAEVHPYLRAGYEDKARRLVRTFTGHTNSVWSVAFSPDGIHALSGSTDSTLKLWDVPSGRLFHTFTHDTGTVISIAFLPDGTRALSGSGETSKLWHVFSGQLLRTFTGPARPFQSQRGRVQVQLKAGWNGNFPTIAYSPDGARALSGGVDGTLDIWDFSSGQSFRTFSDHTGTVMSVAFSLDGTRALSGGGDKTVKLWDVSSRREIYTFTGHANVVTSVAFSPDGRLALSGSWDNTLKLWDTRSEPGASVATGKELRTFKGHTNGVLSAAFSPDGRYIVSGAFKGTPSVKDPSPNAIQDGKTAEIKLWVASTGQLLHTFTAHAFDVNSVAFSPDGRFILSGSDDHTMKLWDVSEWTQAG